VLQCVAVCSSVSCLRRRELVDVVQRVAACCSVLQRVAACCSVLQRVAVCCFLLQCVLSLPSKADIFIWTYEYEDLLLKVLCVKTAALTVDFASQFTYTYISMQ